MKYSTRLDSAVFQLTPTRTRFDLVISANGRTEKIASGLVNPFLSHLKTAQDQMANGGYSIILEPEPGIDATWFTRGTVERFVRFVSTPEILERVYTLESEIFQIEEAIAIQSNNDIGLDMVEDHQKKPVERIEGSRPILDPNEKAIVLYSPGEHPPEANGSTAQEGNAKVQLMKVLETRKSLLCKEQGMAFARAVAAGFDIDHMAALMSFAESFGASRLMDACMRFKELWKRKHETGQWVEVEAAEAMSSQSNFSAMNASGIMLSSAINKQWPGTPESSGKAGVESTADEKSPMDQQPSPANQGYFQGQYPQPMFPAWPIHSPPGTMHVFQGYPMQCIPYYQNYPGNSPFTPPQHRSDAAQRRGRRRQSMDSGDGNTDPETEDVDVELENGTQESGRKSSRSSKKKSGMVVIRNINYITSKRQESSSSESESASGSESDEGDRDLLETTSSVKHKNSQKSSKSRVSKTKSADKLELNEADGGNWQAFQSFLLKGADDAEHGVDKDVFAMEKDIQVKRSQNKASHDPLLLEGRGLDDNEDGDMTDMQRISGNFGQMKRVSNDESFLSQRSSDGGSFMDGPMDIQSAEVNGRIGRYRSASNDFMIHKRENHSSYMSAVPLAGNGFVHPRKDLIRSSSQNMNDDSYVVQLRSMLVDQVGTCGRHPIDMDSEFPSSRPENAALDQGKYEPDALSLMPERGMENGTIGYDPALDYEMQVQAGNGKNKAAVTGAKQGSKKVEKDWKSKLIPDTSDKKTVGPIRKGKPSKLSPMEEARARAEKLRNYKADLQKIKKEKEEQEMKRLEALKLERQKRIAARGSSDPVQPTSLKARKQLPSKLSPSPRKSSKFSDSEPGSISPLQGFQIRTISAGSTDSLKASKPSKLNATTNSVGNQLTRLVSSMPEPKKESSSITPNAKASMARIRRLSEPKMSSSNHVSSDKPRKSEPLAKSKLSTALESKKISAIVNYDKNKIASLPELKIKTTKRSYTSYGKTAAKEIPQKVKDSKICTSSEDAELKRNNDKILNQSDGDDNPIIEKTVVIQECEKPSVSAVRSEENTGENGHSINYIVRENPETVLNYAAIRAPVSPPNMDRVDKEPSKLQATTENGSNVENKLPKASNISHSEKPYQAPFARVSSLEDSCTRNSEYGKAPPTSLQTAITESEIVRAHVSDPKSFKLEMIPEVSDKPQTKESSKGFRRLLKFGKKSNSSGERNSEPDNVITNDSEANDSVGKVASSGEVHTLKNLISQDETPTCSISQKTSRHFSLLSPFRSKNSEKKLST